MNKAPLSAAVWIRKSIHVVWGVCVLVILQSIPQYASFLVSGWAVGMLVVDLLRFRWAWWAQWVHRVFGNLFKPHEFKALTGATQFIVGCAIVSLVFPPKIASAAVAILTFADGLATLVGKQFPVGILPNHKTLSGSFTFFIVASGVLFKYFMMVNITLMTIALVITVVEGFSAPWFENVAIPVVSASLIYIFIG